MATTDSSVPAHPSTREDRALELYQAHGHKIVRLAENFYRVPSQDGQRSYDVLYGGEREECPCPDFEFGHGRACKHLLAVGIMHAIRRAGVREVRAIRVASGDPFRTARLACHLGDLEDELRHADLGIEERCELEDRVRRVRRRLASGR